MRRIALAFIALSLTLSVLVAGCATPATKDYSTYFHNEISQGNETVTVSRMSKKTDSVYTGAYRDWQSTHIYTIEVAQSEAAAKERFGQLVLEKQDDGYSSSRIVTDSPNYSASWSGTKGDVSVSGSQYLILYKYDSDIREWLVETIQN
ncbi:MAG: hypothetical protein LUP95_06955 [Euryarchaeota archaeon]|nr:hypothetical protein [Euryarchaeota archaeon]